MTVHYALEAGKTICQCGKGGDTMTDTHEKFIERVRAYTEKATPGPWEFDEKWKVVVQAKCGLSEPQNICSTPNCFYGIGQDEVWANMRLIANARTDLPAALSIIETLVRERDALRRLIADNMPDLTPEQAQKEFDEAVPTPIDEAEISRIVNRVMAKRAVSEFGNSPLENIKAKCEQYWNERGVSDEEFHVSLERIHEWATQAENERKGDNGQA